MLQKQAEAWLRATHPELADYIIKQARVQSMGDRQLYEDLIQEGILCLLESEEV